MLRHTFAGRSRQLGIVISASASRSARPTRITALGPRNGLERQHSSPRLCAITGSDPGATRRRRWLRDSRAPACAYMGVARCGSADDVPSNPCLFRKGWPGGRKRSAKKLPRFRLGANGKPCSRRPVRRILRLTSTSGPTRRACSRRENDTLKRGESAVTEDREAERISSPKTNGPRCPACAAFPKLATRFLDPRSGKTIRLYRCQCGERSVGRLRPRLARPRDGSTLRTESVHVVRTVARLRALLDASPIQPRRDKATGPYAAFGFLGFVLLRQIMAGQ